MGESGDVILVSVIAIFALSIVSVGVALWMQRRRRASAAQTTGQTTGQTAGQTAAPSKWQRFAQAATLAGAERQAGNDFAITRDGLRTLIEQVETSDEETMVYFERALSAVDAPEALPELPAMTLRAEDESDQLGKSLGLNLELQTGDADFDAKVYIESDGFVDAAAEVLASRSTAGWAG